MRWLWILFSPWALAANPIAGAGEFYRFTDEHGRPQISHTIPPQAVAGGYQILDSRLFVIHTVAPELTPAEQLARDQAQAAQALAEQRARQDQALLDRFPSVADVEAAAASEMDRLQLQVDIQEKTLEIQQQSLAALQRKAAREERDGAVQPETLNAITTQRKAVEKASGALAKRRQLHADLAALYAARKARVQSLTQR